MSSKTLPTPSENISTFSYPIRFFFYCHPICPHIITTFFIFPAFCHEIYHFGYEKNNLPYLSTKWYNALQIEMTYFDSFFV